MTLPELSVKRPTAITMFFVCLILLGIIAAGMLPVEMMPNVSFGDISINIDVRGGMPATEVEKRITKIVEEAVGSVSYLKNLISISKEGNATVILEFEPGTDMDFAALEVREKFNRVRNNLPSEAEKPIIAKFEYTDVPVMIVALTSATRSQEELRKIVDEKVKDRIQRIEGVANAEVVGGREGKVLIEVDQRKLQSYGLPINRLVDIVNVNNENALAGEVMGARDKLLVRTMGAFESLDDIGNLAIATTKEGSVIRLRDVAEIKDSFLEPVSFARLNANPVVSIYVQKETTANTVRISKLVKKEIESLRRSLDRQIEINLISNQADNIIGAVKQVQGSLGYGMIFAIGVLVLFLIKDLRLVFIIAVAIPISLLVTFFLMYFSKLTINVISLSGLALGVGMLVDNAIVVLDNISKKREHLPPETRHLNRVAAMEGADEMLLAITASTLTTIVVFFPIVFINPEIKKLYSGIALTIVFSLIASLLSALTIVPLLASRINTASKPLRLDENGHPLPTPFERFSQAAQTLYRGVISFCLLLRYPLVIVVIFVCVKIFPAAGKLEREFIGLAEQNKFTVFIEMPTGTRLEVSNEIVAKVERIIAGTPEVKNQTAKVEPWSSKIYVELTPFAQRKISTQDVINKLRASTEKLDPAFIYYEEPEELGTKEIIIDIFGYEYEVLKDVAIKIAQKLQGIPRFTDTKIRMREGRPELRLAIDKRQAAMFGLSVEDIALALHTNTRGLVATRYRGVDEPMVRIKGYSELEKPGKAPLGQKPGLVSSAKETETIVRLEEKYRKSFELLRRLTLVTPEGEHVFMNQLADFKFDLGPSEIWRKNKARMVQVSANTGGTALGTAAEKVKEALKDVPIPKDYFWQIGGEYDKMVRNQRELFQALILSLVLVLMILASLFESFTQPLIILTTCPLAAIGAILALKWADKPVGMGVLIGGLMLGGIVVNNAIVLVDRINFLRHKPEYWKKTRESVIEASLDRLRPIMMTSLTTILGLIPMAMDKSESSNLWAPLAITVMGGMTVSTILTLFVVPCVYMIFYDLFLIGHDR